jgi:hypothetical protein
LGVVRGDKLGAYCAAFGGEEGNAWYVGFWVAVDEIENAVGARVEARGDARPGYFTLGGISYGKPGVPSSFNVFAQVGCLTLFVQALKKGWIEGIKSYDYCFHLESKML